MEGHNYPGTRFFNHPHLVHINVASVKLESGNPIVYVGLPAHGLRPKVE